MPPKGNKLDSTSAVHMWGIPYKMLDRAGYDIAFQSNADDDNICFNDDNMHIIYDQENRRSSR